mmetsp:Transcript_5974/g.14516  ORF Transcript_5974/g.14516 Transcript_5974/m.14516 type:complete len:140 (+) Transcript_5974:278-697(+)
MVCNRVFGQIVGIFETGQQIAAGWHLHKPIETWGEVSDQPIHKVLKERALEYEEYLGVLRGLGYKETDNSRRFNGKFKVCGPHAPISKVSHVQISPATVCPLSQDKKEDPEELNNSLFPVKVVLSDLMHHGQSASRAAS